MVLEQGLYKPGGWVSENVSWKDQGLCLWQIRVHSETGLTVGRTVEAGRGSRKEACREGS